MKSTGVGANQAPVLRCIMPVMCAFSSNGHKGKSPDAITVHDVDEFIEWQQSLGRAPATIRRRLIALRMFFDYLAYICEEQIANPVVAQRHYIDQGHRLPSDIRQEDLEKLFAAIGDHLRDRTIFTLDAAYRDESRGSGQSTSGRCFLDLRIAHRICGSTARDNANGSFTYLPLQPNC